MAYSAEFWSSLASCFTSSGQQSKSKHSKQTSEKFDDFEWPDDDQSAIINRSSFRSAKSDAEVDELQRAADELPGRERAGSFTPMANEMRKAGLASFPSEKGQPL